MLISILLGTSEEDEINNLVEDETDIKCCQGGQKLPRDSLHPECFPIEIPSNDFFFSRFSQRCMEFVRSMPAERPDCNLGPREQVCIHKSSATSLQKGAFINHVDRKSFF